MDPEQGRRFMEQVREEGGVSRDRMQHGVKRGKRFVKIDKGRFGGDQHLDRVVDFAASDWGLTVEHRDDAYVARDPDAGGMFDQLF